MIDTILFLIKLIWRLYIMNEKKIYTEQEAKEYAESVSNTLFIRDYNDGNSEDTERQATPQEKEILTNIICGALFAIRTNQLGGIAIQTAKDTAEFTADLMLPYINGYESVYLKIDNFLARYQ